MRMRTKSVQVVPVALLILSILCFPTRAFTSSTPSWTSRTLIRQPIQSRRGQNYAATTALSATTAGSGSKRKKPKPVYLTHERDFFRQIARLESMDSYVLVWVYFLEKQLVLLHSRGAASFQKVFTNNTSFLLRSTLTSSMSFGALIGFSRSEAVAAAIKSSTSGAALLGLFYDGLCLAIQIISGLSAICGLYATMIFSLTVLYSKSALGAERDREYDRFLRKTVRARVHGFRSFSFSLGLFAVDVLLVLIERTFASSCRWLSLPVGFSAAGIILFLYKDWKLLVRTAEESIFKD
jgi:hypothetical protein